LADIPRPRRRFSGSGCVCFCCGRCRRLACPPDRRTEPRVAFFAVEWERPGQARGRQRTPLRSIPAGSVATRPKAATKDDAAGEIQGWRACGQGCPPEAWRSMEATLSFSRSSIGAVLRPFRNRPTGWHVQACLVFLRSRTVRDVSTWQASTFFAGGPCAERMADGELLVEHGEA